MSETHAERIERMRQACREAHARLTARLRSVPPETAERAPAGGGWSAAQIAWHVAAVDRSFAAIASGRREVPRLPEGFVERGWRDIAAEIPEKLQAPDRAMPPPDVTIADALQSLAAAATELDTALAGLDAERGATHGITHPAVGTISINQIGEWAAAHVARHNAQAKKVLGV